MLIETSLSILIGSLAFLFASLIVFFTLLCYHHFTKVPENAPMKPIEHVADLQPDDWGNLIRLNGILRAWKGENSGGKLSINQAPKAALVLSKDSRPEVEVFDDGFTEIQESSSRLQRDMTLKGFTESGIHAALAGGAHGVTLGLGGGISWLKDETAFSDDTSENMTLHGFYNFPRAIVYLNPVNFDLSDACIDFMKEHKDNNDTKQVLEEFFLQFGGFIATRVTLGARLCTREEVDTGQRFRMAALKKELKSQLEATVMTPAGGFSMGGSHSHSTEAKDQKNLSEKGQHMLIETQGGDSFLASNIQDWKASVRSHKNWRVIQQSSPRELLSFLEEASKRSQPGANSKDCYDTIKKLNRYIVDEHKNIEQEADETFNLVLATSFYPNDRYTRFDGCICPSRPEIVDSITAKFDADTQPVLYVGMKALSTTEADQQLHLSNPETYKFEPQYNPLRRRMARGEAENLMISSYKMFSTWERTFPYEKGKQRACKVTLQIVLNPKWTWKDGHNNTNTKELVIQIDKCHQGIIPLRVQRQPQTSSDVTTTAEAVAA